MIRIARIYDAPAPEQGARLLVDRLWPRGLSKDAARLDAWLRALAPSDALRKQYHGQTANCATAWNAFCRDYSAELDRPVGEAAEALRELDKWIALGRVTLLYAARDPQRNNAEALRLWLNKRV